MGYFKAVRSGGEISMRIADLLETAAPKEYTGANRVKTILECNDVLQGRADNISIGMLEEFLEQKCGACYPERVAELKQESWVCIVAAVPIAVTGFFQYNGLTFEQFAWAFTKSQILCAGPRVFQSENIYLTALERKGGHKHD